MKKLIMTAVVAIAIMTGAAACELPEGAYIDYNKDGVIDADERAWREAVVVNKVKEVVNRRNDKSMHPFLVCVRRHESDRGAYPYKGGYSAQNPVSSASGAYQFIDGTWRSASASAGYGGQYSRAKFAPAHVQDAVAYHTAITLGQRSHWNGAGC